MIYLTIANPFHILSPIISTANEWSSGHSCEPAPFASADAGVVGDEIGEVAGAAPGNATERIEWCCWFCFLVVRRNYCAPSPLVILHALFYLPFLRKSLISHWVSWNLMRNIRITGLSSRLYSQENDVTEPGPPRIAHLPACMITWSEYTMKLRGPR